jgi:hypothetical protein
MRHLLLVVTLTACGAAPSSEVVQETKEASSPSFHTVVNTPESAVDPRSLCRFTDTTLISTDCLDDAGVQQVWCSMRSGCCYCGPFPGGDP